MLLLCIMQSALFFAVVAVSVVAFIWASGERCVATAQCSKRLEEGGETDKREIEFLVCRPSQCVTCAFILCRSPLVVAVDDHWQRGLRVSFETDAGDNR